MKKLTVGFCFVLLLAALALYGAAPSTTVSPVKHPNLAKAQSMVDMAYQKIVQAQKANEYDMGGHAAKAKTLLEQANDELKQAAMAASPGGNNNTPPNANRPEDVPDTNVSAKGHPNIAEAQSLIRDAYTNVVAAQKANEYDMGGHAAKAKTFLEQASDELKMAAQEANHK